MYHLGTPKGVGSVKPGDVITAGLQIPGQKHSLSELFYHVKERQGGFLFKH